jgi:hypothetical protein
MRFKMKNEVLMNSHRLRAGVPTFALALVFVAVAGTAIAGTEYDGDWSVLIVTHAGACEPTFRYGVQIANGMVINDGGSVTTAQGRVTPRGPRGSSCGPVANGLTVPAVSPSSMAVFEGPRHERQTFPDHGKIWRR